MGTVYIVLYENPNEFNPYDDDILREVVGVYTDRESAQRVLEKCQTDNEQAHLYSIEEWEDHLTI